jgi:phage terminase large subunit-like protein
MAATAPKRRSDVGVTAPRLAPPVPAKTLLTEFTQAGADMGIELMPWQQLAGRYVTALDGNRWRYPEVAIVVARQNGKTELLKPYILQRLRMGRKILHTAQNRMLPRETFLEIASLLAGSEFVTEIRQANGQETIRTVNGGKYTLVAPRPGVRGHGVDDVILDEVREQRSFDLIAGIKPTLTASRDRQILYLSNAGDEASVVLNDLRRRADKDARLAYLEWSAAPDRALDDRDGWAEANPALGITIQLDTLADFHDSLPAPVWETEHLCRWVISMQPRLVPDHAWQKLQAILEAPLRPSMAISMDVSGKRASADIAWQQSDGTIALSVIADVTGDPIDTDKLGKDLKQAALRFGVSEVAYDPWTDADLARHFDSPGITVKPLISREYANASENFARIIESGRLRWSDEAGHLSDDLNWCARKSHESGSWLAVKASEDRPITSILAAVRATWLASGPRKGLPQVF